MQVAWEAWVWQSERNVPSSKILHSRRSFFESSSRARSMAWLFFLSPSPSPPELMQLPMMAVPDLWTGLGRISQVRSRRQPRRDRQSADCWSGARVGSRRMDGDCGCFWKLGAGKVRRQVVGRRMEGRASRRLVGFVWCRGRIQEERAANKRRDDDVSARDRRNESGPVAVLSILDGNDDGDVEDGVWHWPCVDLTGT